MSTSSTTSLSLAGGSAATVILWADNEPLFFDLYVRPCGDNITNLQHSRLVKDRL